MLLGTWFEMYGNYLFCRGQPTILAISFKVVLHLSTSSMLTSKHFWWLIKAFSKGPVCFSTSDGSTS